MRTYATLPSLLTGLCVAACLAGCMWEDPLEWPARAPGARAGGVLRLAAAEDVPTLDPAIGYDTRSWFFEQHLFETLVTYDDASTLVPLLAERWEISDDGRRYRFELAPGVVFSDGTPLTAADAAGSIERVLDPETRSQGAQFYRGIVGARAYVDGTEPHVQGLQAPDAHTLVITLAAPDPLFLHKLALLFASVVPVAQARDLGEDFATRPLGSGPFVLREWRRGERIVLARNTRYRRSDRPYLDGVVQHLGVGVELAWLMFESGELDVVAIPPADFPVVQRAPARQPYIMHQTLLSTMYVGLNCGIPPFDDRRVRQALNYAVKKTDILELLNGRGIAARGIVPPTMPNHDAGLTGYDYDVERARALLAAAGQGEGFTTELWTQSSDMDLKIAQKLQQDLAAVDIHMRIKQVAWSPFLDAIRRPQIVPMFDLGWNADFPEPSNFLHVLFHSTQHDANNHTFYASTEFDRLIGGALAAVAPAARAQLYAAAERLVVEDAPMIFLYHPISYAIRTPRVRDYRIHAFVPPRLTEVWLAPDRAELDP